MGVHLACVCIHIYSTLIVCVCVCRKRPHTVHPVHQSGQGGGAWGGRGEGGGGRCHTKQTERGKPQAITYCVLRFMATMLCSLWAMSLVILH